MKKKIVKFLFTFILMIICINVSAKENYITCYYSSSDGSTKYHFTLVKCEKWDVTGGCLNNSYVNDGVMEKYEGKEVNKNADASYPGGTSGIELYNMLSSGVCLPYAKATGKSTVYIGTVSELQNVGGIELSLSNTYEQNKSNLELYNNLTSEQTCAYKFGSTVLKQALPKIWSGSYYQFTGGASGGGIITSTCPASAYYVCKNDNTNCTVSFAQSKPIFCNDDKYKCYVLPNDNGFEKAEDPKKEEKIVEYSKTYYVSKAGTGEFGELLIFKVKYDVANDESLQTTMNVGGNPVNVSYPGGVDSFRSSVLKKIAYNKEFPTEIYCGKLSSMVMLADSAYSGSKKAGDVYCSTSKSSFNVNGGQLAKYTLSKNDAFVVDEEDGEGNGNGNNKVNTIRTCISCGDVLDNVPANLPKFSRGLITSLQIIVPALLILLGMYDFIRAVMAGDDKIMKETKNKFIRRTMAGIMIFFVVAIVRFAFGLVPNDTDVLGCVPCFISDEASCGSAYDCN